MSVTLQGLLLRKGIEQVRKTKPVATSDFTDPTSKYGVWWVGAVCQCGLRLLGFPESELHISD